MDPRISLKEELYMIGISLSDSTTIALDAGSSQVSMGKEYFGEYKYSDDIIEKALNIVVKFYKGELFAN